MAGIVYIHVPKCGGSSFSAALKLRYIFSQETISLNQGDPRLKGHDYILSDYNSRDAQLGTSMSKNTKLISGHVRYNPAMHRFGADKYSFITLLRDPVQRFVSHYNYLQRQHPDPNRPSALDAFLETDDAARIASQYLFYFARYEHNAPTNKQAAVQRAIDNLRQFSLIGDLSSPAQFASALARMSGMPLPVWHRNKAPNPTYVPPRLYSKISDLCAGDIEIYDAVQNRRIAA